MDGAAHAASIIETETSVRIHTAVRVATTTVEQAGPRPVRAPPRVTDTIVLPAEEVVGTAMAIDVEIAIETAVAEIARDMGVGVRKRPGVRRCPHSRMRMSEIDARCLSSSSPLVFGRKSL